MNLPLPWREKLFKHAQSLGLSGALFQNEMNITPEMISDEMDEVLKAKKEQINKHDRYLASLRNMLVKIDENNA